MASGFESLQPRIRQTLRSGTQFLLRGVRYCTKGWRRTVFCYLVAVVTVGLGTACRLGMDPLLGNHQPFTIYFAAVAITAWYGGFGPALLSTVLAYLAADWFFIPPRFEFHRPHSTNYDEFVGLVAFLFSSLAIAFTSKVMRQALQKARQRQRELMHEIVERERAEKDLQQAQAQLRQYAAQLEERVEERTAHLQETVHSLEGV
jgi:K+-sensing histidine kinase KdpD